MDVWRITVATLRRWYIFLPLLALTGWGVFAVGAQVQPEYRVSAQFMLTSGSVVSEIPDPYGGATQAAAVIAIVLNSPTTQAQIAASGLEPNYTVTATDRSTLMTASVTSGSEERAVETAAALIERARQDLDTRQGEAGLPTAAQLGLDVLSPPSVVEQIYDGKVQRQAIVGVLGAAVALFVTLAFDDTVGLIRRGIARHRGYGPESRAREVKKDDELDSETSDVRDVTERLSSPSQTEEARSGL